MSLPHLVIRLLLILFLIGIHSSPAESETLHMPRDRGDLQQAIDASSEGDTILVGPGDHWSAGHWVPHSLFIIGEAGSEETRFIQCGDLCAPWLMFLDDVEEALVSGFTLIVEDDYGVAGMGIECDGPTSLEVRDCVFSGWEGNEPLLDPISVPGDGTNRVIVTESVFEGIPTSAIRISGPLRLGEISSCTFVDCGPAIYLNQASGLTVRSNLIAGAGVRCRDVNESDIVFRCNNSLIWVEPDSFVPDYWGCPDPTGRDGNISADPIVCGGWPYHGRYPIRVDSPCSPEMSPPGCGLIGRFEVRCDAPPGEEIGACCSRETDCLITEEAECQGVDLAFVGGSCTPDPCPGTPIAVEMVTWGQIKSLYRR